jgi:GNAT superfamily N-acetyltransferase
MVALRGLPYLRAVDGSDDDFLYDVFATTWESEVAALPNQNLARHVLRIQHFAQERRFASRYPGHRRFLVTCEGERAGRLYVFGTDTEVEVLDLTLLPEFHERGIEGRVLGALRQEAARDGRPVTLRTARTDLRAGALYTSLGFDLVSADDVDHVYSWSPATTASPPAGADVPVTASGVPHP